MRLRHLVLALLLGAITASASVLVTRRGPDYQMTCAVGELDCPELILAGGWPAAFLIDSPWMSVRNGLSFEDVFRWPPFVADVGFHAYLWTLLFWLARRGRERRPD